MHSVPDWLAELWWEELGRVDARALLARGQRARRVGRARQHARRRRRGRRAEHGVATHPAPGLPEGARRRRPVRRAERSELWREGAIMPQSRASMRVAGRWRPQPGERVLDLCAAPGRQDDPARGADRASGARSSRSSATPARAAALGETCARMRASACGSRSATRRSRRPTARFDRVLVDPPCSGLGTLQSRPDLRWRASREAIAELAELQARSSPRARALRPWRRRSSTRCARSPARESEGVIDGFLGENPELRELEA